MVQGVYQFQLKVTDNGGATGLDNMQVTVNGTGEILLPAVGELLQEVQQAVDNYGLRTHRGAFSLLGTVVGNNAARMKELVEEKVDKWGKALELLTRKEVPAQLALLVARWSMVAKPNYLMRSLPPSLTTDALRNHDNTIIRVVEERLQLHFTDTAKKLLQLPIRQGGVGFCSAADVAEHAFVAGTLASQIALLSFSNLYQHRFESFSEGLLLKELHKSLARYRASPLDWPGKEHMTTVETFFNHFGNKEKSHKLQVRLTRPSANTKRRSSSAPQDARTLRAWSAEQTRPQRSSGEPFHSPQTFGSRTRRPALQSPTPPASPPLTCPISAAARRDSRSHSSTPFTAWKSLPGTT